MSSNKHENCQELLASMSDYIDGTLGNQLCLEIERHLAGCSDCRIVVDTLRKTISLYKRSTSDQSSLPDAVQERLYHKLDLEEFNPKSRK